MPNDPETRAAPSAPVLRRLRRSGAVACVFAAALTVPGVAQGPSYRLVEGWAELPEGVEAWGQTIGVEIDGDYLWVFHRCFDSTCVGREDVPPILKYDMQGRLVDSWGEGKFVWPHGFYLDQHGNLWTTDGRGRDGIGQQVIEFAPDGRELLRLGRAGVGGTEPGLLNGPSDVAVADNGDIFVAEGHGGNRVVKFSADGRYLMSWGEGGTGPGQFDEAHSIDIDSRGRVLVGDRLNQRIQVFDQEGHFLEEWHGVMASGMHITDDDVLYIADYQLREGIVIVDARDFTELGFIEGTLPEGVTVDRHGNVYAGETIPRALKKFEKRPGS